MLSLSGGGDFPHEDGTIDKKEIFGSEDNRDQVDDQASKTNTSTITSLLYIKPFLNNKAPKGKWSKEDTELFYKALKQFGTDFSMIRKYFPNKTIHQVKLKYKKEARQNPLQLSDALNNPATDHSLIESLIENLQKDHSRDASYLMQGEMV